MRFVVLIFTLPCSINSTYNKLVKYPTALMFACAKVFLLFDEKHIVLFC